MAKQHVSVRLERELLHRVDLDAAREGLSRSGFIARAMIERVGDTSHAMKVNRLARRLAMAALSFNAAPAGKGRRK